MGSISDNKLWREIKCFLQKRLGIEDIIQGDNIIIDKTNPKKPIISSTGGGGSGSNAINTETPITGSGISSSPVNILSASTSSRGSMSIAHFNKLENVNFSDYMLTTQPANNITNTNISNWNTAYGWGDHSTIGYLQTSTLTGIGNRLMQADAIGNVTANLIVEELYVTESDIITALTSISDAIWIANNNINSISPTTNVFKRGKVYINSGFRYEAVSDNIALRLGGASSGGSSVTLTYGGGANTLGPQLTGTIITDAFVNNSGTITSTAGWKYKSFDIPIGYTKIRFNNIGLRPASTPAGYYRFLNSSGTLISFGSFNSNEDKTISIPTGATKFEIDIKATSDTDAVYSSMNVWSIYLAPDYVTAINGKPLTIATSTISGIPTNQTLNTNDSVQFSHVTTSGLTLLNIPTDRTLVAIGELFIDTTTEQIKVKLT